MSNDKIQTAPEAANQNTISLSDIAKGAGIDEETLLRRLAGILSAREALPNGLIDRTPRDPASGDPYWISRDRIEELARQFVDGLHSEGYDVEGRPVEKPAIERRIAEFAHNVVTGRLS